MTLAKNIITAFLALLLANPACCCALRSCASTVENSPVQSCCTSSSDEENNDEDAPDQDHKCHCSLDEKSIEQVKIDWVAPAVTALPTPTYVELPKVSYAPVLIDMPDLSAHPPPLSSIRILFSVFRL